MLIFAADVPVIGAMIKPPVTIAEPELIVSASILVESAIKLPPSIRVSAADPPVRLAVPLLFTVRFPSVIFEVRVPPVTFDKPVTVPPVRVVLPLDVRALRVPPVRFRMEAEMVFPLTLPPVILAVPLVTLRLPSVTFDSKRPPVIFVRLVTDPPVKVVLPLDVSVFSVPPVTFNVEAEMVSPLTLPPVRLAIPLVTFRLPIVTLDSKIPPVIFVRPVTVPPVRVVLPLDVSVFNVPPVTFRLEAERVSPLTLPPIRLAVPLVTFRLASVTLDSNRPPVIFVRLVTVPPVRVVLPLDVKVFRIPPVTFRLSVEIVLPLTLPPVILAVPLVTVRQPRETLDVSIPPVTFESPVTFPPVRLVVPLVSRA